MNVPHGEGDDGDLIKTFKNQSNFLLCKILES